LHNFWDCLFNRHLFFNSRTDRFFKPSKRDMCLSSKRKTEGEMRLGPPKDEIHHCHSILIKTEKLWAVLLSVGLHSQVPSFGVFLLLGVYEKSSPGITIRTAILSRVCMTVSKHQIVQKMLQNWCRMKTNHSKITGNFRNTDITSYCSVASQAN
jgi:hypothetical protein